MALELDKGSTALLVMDLENDLIHEEGAFKDFGFAQMVKDNDVLGKTNSLLAAARRAQMKVIYVSVKFRPGHPEVSRNTGLFQAVVDANALVEGTWGAEIHEAVKPREGEPVVTKRAVSAFAASDLEKILQASGIKTLVLTGVATNFVVEGTAREAADRGYNVVVVGDCCASMSQEAHDSALTTALPFLATLTTSDEAAVALG
jgi:gluconolactonase